MSWPVFIQIIIATFLIFGVIAAYAYLLQKYVKRSCSYPCCSADGWDGCSDNRCRYHCGKMCQCVPSNPGPSLKVLDGGRK